MLVIWSNCNSMMSLSTHVLVWYQHKEGRPLQEGQDIGHLRPLRNEEDFTVHYNNGNYNCWRLRRLGEFEGSVEFPYLYDLGRLPLWNLSDY